MGGGCVSTELGEDKVDDAGLVAHAACQARLRITFPKDMQSNVNSKAAVCSAKLRNA